MGASRVMRSAWLVLLAATALATEVHVPAAVVPVAAAVPPPPADPHAVAAPPPADPHAVAAPPPADPHAVVPPPAAPPAQTSPQDEDFELSHGVPEPATAPGVDPHAAVAADPFNAFPFNPAAADPHAPVLHAADPHAAGAHADVAADAHGADAHGEGTHDAHGGHGHASEGNMEVSFTASACLLGMVTSFHLLFYLVNCKYKLIRAMTWKMSSSTVSIFIAVLLWGVIHSIHHEYFAPHVGFLDIPHVPCMMFILMWSVSQLALFVWKENLAHTATIAMLGAHMTGFCAIHAFGKLQEHSYSVAPSTALLCAILFAAVVTVLAQIWINIRRGVALAGDGRVDEEEKHWFEKCQEFEDEVVALVMGFLIAQVVRFLAVGRFISDHEDPKATAGADKMILAGIIFLIATIGMTILRGSMKGCGKMVDRAVGVTQHILGMTSAWCNMFGLKRWIVASLSKTLDSTMLAMMVMAMFDTMLAACTVIILQQVVSNFQVNAKVLRSIISAVALLVGLAWEKTFHHAIHSIAHSGKVDPDEEHATIKLSLILAAVVLPAWKWHILHKGDHRLAALAQKEDDNDDSAAKLAEESGEEEEEEEHRHVSPGKGVRRDMFTGAPPARSQGPRYSAAPGGPYTSQQFSQYAPQYSQQYWR